MAASVAVTPGSLTLAQGTTEQLVVEVLDASGRALSGVPVQYTSTDSARVSVSASGLVQAVGAVGLAAIQVRADTATARIPVQVTATPRRLTITPDTSLLLPGAGEQLSAVLRDLVDAPIAGAVITFSSSDSAIVRIMPNGDAVSVGPSGAATVTATSDTFTARALVVVAGHPTGLIVVHTSLDPTAGVAVSRSGVVILTHGGSFTMGQLPDTLFSPRINGGDPNARIIDQAFASNGAVAYLPDLQGGKLGVFDVSNRTISGYPFQVPGGYLMSIAVSPDDARLYVGCNNDTVYTLDAATGAKLHATDAHGWSIALALHPSQPLLYASTYNGGRVAEINTNSGLLVRLLLVGGTPQSVAVSPNGSELYIANEASGLQVWDLVGDSLKDGVPVAGGGYGLALSPDQTEIWMTSAGPGALTGQVYVFDRATRSVRHTINVGGTPLRIAFDFGGTTAVVADNASAVVYIK